MTLRAAIDIGTNSVRLLVADTSVHPPRRVATGLAVTRLGNGLDRSGLLAAENVSRTCDAVERFTRQAQDLGASPVLFGTAALREASNGRDVAETIATRAGCPLRIIAGSEEAAVTFRGVLVGRSLPEGAMVLDIGGGSTEFITARTQDGHLQINAHSLELGSVRQTERYLVGDPPSALERDALFAEIDTLVVQGIDGRRVTHLVGVAGSVTQVAALELAMTVYDPDRVEGMELSSARVRAWRDRLFAMTVAERRGLIGMVPERAETVLAGTAILDATLSVLGLPHVVVSEFDSLWGMVAGFVPDGTRLPVAARDPALRGSGFEDGGGAS